MKRRQLSKKTIATLAMMGLASSILMPSTAAAAQNSNQQQQYAAAGCGSGCGSHKRGLSDNDQGRTRRYNPAQQTADGSCGGQQAPASGCNGQKAPNGSCAANKKPANGTSNPTANQANPVPSKTK